jgi:ATP-binding cassette subfamily B protein
VAKSKGFSADTLRRVLRYVRPQAGWMAFSLLLSLVSVALSLYIPILVGRSIDTMVSAGRVRFEFAFYGIEHTLILW